MKPQTLSAPDRRPGRDGRTPAEKALDQGGNLLWWSVIGVIGSIGFCFYLIWAIALAGSP
ncbi:MAG: hypothetical protein IVW56_09500 [Candidatus Binataceae bacterium]|nr:hypothetical protein [Candidatus Binataceae bacterium]